MDNSIDVYTMKARGGDCFVVDFRNGHAILIDGGYTDTCTYELIPMLKRMKADGIELDWVILTHYDDDHINGLARFIKKNGKKGSEKIISVGGIIANGFSNVAEDDDGGKTLEAISEQIVEIEVGAKREYDFEHECLKNGYAVNEFKRGGGVVSGDILELNGYVIKFVSPSREALDKYYAEMKEKVRESEFPLSRLNLQNMAINCQARAEDAVITERRVSAPGICDISQWTELDYTRKLTMPNRSSLAFELSYGGKKLLFCGDADMKEYRELLSDSYDLIKLSHHGTVRGNECFFGEGKVTSDVYLISTDGSRVDRSHPSRRLLGELITDGREKTLLFNYNIVITSNEDFNLLKSEKQREKYGFKALLGRNRYSV